MKRIEKSLFVTMASLKHGLVLTFAILIMSINASLGQDKQVVQIKTFDHQLKALGSIDISINDKDFIAVNAKGSAFTELSQGDLPPKSVRIKNEELEAESWNYSKGVIEIIIRKKSFKLYL